MTDKVAAYMRQFHMVQKGDHICIGLSGGADSVCLFRILEHLRQQMEITLSAVHIEHGIRGAESLEDMEFARQLAEYYEVPFAIYAYPVEQIAKEQGLSVEEAGRNVRYETFFKEAEKYQEEAKSRGGNVKIALAHHGNDNAETMLFHLCRGSGIDGLAGIRPVRDNIIRPLLCLTRSEIEAYLKKEEQSYRTDATNADNIYSRNRIRNCILPELEKVNDKTVAHMNSLAEDVAELSNYLHGEVEQILQKHIVEKESESLQFEVEGLDKYPTVLQRRVMLELLANVCGSRKDIAREHTKAMLDIAHGQVGRQVSLPYGMLAEKIYGRLRIFSAKAPARLPAEKNSIKLPIVLPERNQIEGISVQLPETEIFSKVEIKYQVFEISEKNIKFTRNKYTKWFDCDKIKNTLELRNRQSGDYFVVDGEGHRKKLKDYWINEKVPKAKRDQILLLADGSHILWAIGYRISEYYKITENTKRVLEVQYMEERT